MVLVILAAKIAHSHYICKLIVLDNRFIIHYVVIEKNQHIRRLYMKGRIC